MRRSAATAIAACCIAREATIRFRAPDGARPNCHLCLNCVGDCPHGGLRFRFFPREREAKGGPDVRRRHIVSGTLAGLALGPLLGAEREAHPLRPPGALEESAFLARCIRCGECLRVCPNNALQPAWSEAGVEGLWTPVVVPAWDTARRVARCAARSAPPARFGNSPGERRAGRASRGPGMPLPSASARRFTIAGGACRGRARPSVLSARSGAPHRPRPSISGPPRLRRPTAACRRCASLIWTRGSAWAAAPANLHVPYAASRPFM